MVEEPIAETKEKPAENAKEEILLEVSFLQCASTGPQS